MEKRRRAKRKWVSKGWREKKGSGERLRERLRERGREAIK